MPSRAIWFDGWPTVSWPSNVTEPLRLPTMPMIERSVVVLPAPLRPSNVTSSPRQISKSMPCSTCDSPYQASRPATLRSGSTMTGTDIGFDDQRVLRHRGIGSFRQHLAAREHSDSVGEVGHHGHVVLDHQHRTVL